MNKDAELLIEAEDNESPVCIWRVSFEFENLDGLILTETLDVTSFDDGEVAVRKARSYLNEISEDVNMKPDTFKLNGLRLLAKSEVN